MAVIGQGVSLRGIYHADAHYPFLFSGADATDHVGKAVTLDTTAANTVKLAGDGDAILGVIRAYENRAVEGIKLVTVTNAGGMGYSIADGATVAVGDTLVGAGAGFVKAAATPNWSDNVVVEVAGGTATALLK